MRVQLHSGIIAGLTTYLYFGIIFSFESIETDFSRHAKMFVTHADIPQKVCAQMLSIITKFEELKIRQFASMKCTFKQSAICILAVVVGASVCFILRMRLQQLNIPQNSLMRRVEQMLIRNVNFGREVTTDNGESFLLCYHPRVQAFGNTKQFKKL